MIYGCKFNVFGIKNIIHLYQDFTKNEDGTTVITVTRGDDGLETNVEYTVRITFDTPEDSLTVERECFTATPTSVPCVTEFRYKKCI